MERKHTILRAAALSLIFSSILQGNCACADEPKLVVIPQTVNALPGKLNNTLMFNSNSPEIVQTEGILLSTFPCNSSKVPCPHLNKPLQGSFEVFLHHINKSSPEDQKTLYIGLLAYNPSAKKTVLHINQAVSYLSQPDAPFIALPSQADNPDGTIYAGPGDRVTNDILRGKSQDGWRHEIELAPHEYAMLAVLAIPVLGLVPPLNGRTALLKCQSSGPVYLASLAAFPRIDFDGKELAPDLKGWKKILHSDIMAGPREAAGGFGRVAGIQEGSIWNGRISDNNGDSKLLSIPDPGQGVSYVVCSVAKGTLGSGQVQSAPLVVHYPETALQAHGNYGVEYKLEIPLYNGSSEDRNISIKFQTPLKKYDTNTSLSFAEPPYDHVYFRGTLKLRYKDDSGQVVEKFIHLVQKQGQQGQPLVTLNLKSKERRDLSVDFIYPADCSPPQVITIETAL